VPPPAQQHRGGGAGGRKKRLTLTPYRWLQFAIATELGKHVSEIEEYELEHLLEWDEVFKARAEERERRLEELRNR
jgi:hypothetical protein